MFNCQSDQMIQLQEKNLFLESFSQKIRRIRDAGHNVVCVSYCRIIKYIHLEYVRNIGVRVVEYAEAYYVQYMLTS